MSSKHRNRLARLRKAQGLSQRELAAQIPSVWKNGGPTVASRTIDRWERGTTPIPERHWHQLSAIFGVSVAHLLRLDDDKNGDNGDGDGIRRVA